MTGKTPWQPMRLVRVGHVGTVVRQFDSCVSPTICTDADDFTGI